MKMAWLGAGAGHAKLLQPSVGLGTGADMLDVGRVETAADTKSVTATIDRCSAGDGNSRSYSVSDIERSCSVQCANEHIEPKVHRAPLLQSFVRKVSG